MRASMWLLGVLFLAGCAQTVAPPGKDGPAPPADLEVVERRVVASLEGSWEGPAVWQSDPSVDPGRLERAPGVFVTGGFVALEFAASWTDTASTGYRLGYSIDDGEIVWVEDLPNGATNLVPIPEGTFETHEERWMFWWSPGSSVGPETGAGIGAGSTNFTVTLIPP